MIKIETARNGFIVTTEEGRDIFEDTLEGFQELLYVLVGELGYAGSRYDEKRICVRLEPGDKYEDS